jgi:hypothetical protein
MVNITSINIKTTKGYNMTATQMVINAIYFALSFCGIFLGLIIAIHLSFWLGISMIILFTFKFMYHFSNKEFA